MNWIPNWYALALLSLASWRTFQLLAWDDIADPLRRRVTRLGNDWNEPGDPVPDDYRYSWAKFIECPYCFGFWISVAWYLAWLIAGIGALVLSVPLAISTVLIGIEDLTEGSSSRHVRMPDLRCGHALWMQ